MASVTGLTHGDQARPQLLGYRKVPHFEYAVFPAYYAVCPAYYAVCPAPYLPHCRRPRGLEKVGRPPPLASTSDLGRDQKKGVPILDRNAFMRTERDSNPRYGHPYAGFQNQCLKPLSHPSNRNALWPRSRCAPETTTCFDFPRRVVFEVLASFLRLCQTQVGQSFWGKIEDLPGIPGRTWRRTA